MIGSGSGCLDDLTSDRRSCNSVMKTNEKSVAERACGLATNCYACQKMTHCVWLAIDTKRVCVSKSDHALILEQHNRRQATERLHYDDLPSTSHHLLSTTSSKLTTNSPASNTWNSYRELHSTFGAMSIFNSTVDKCPEACADFTGCFDCIRAQCM